MLGGNHHGVLGNPDKMTPARLLAGIAFNLKFIFRLIDNNWFHTLLTLRKETGSFLLNLMVAENCS